MDAGTGIISTVAGAGGFGCGALGGAATATDLQFEGIAVGSDGSLLIADGDCDRVLSVDLATGLTSLFAGTGVAGFSGDGGPATAAMLPGPSALAVDGTGNVFIADKDNHRVRMVDPVSGLISTVAGTGVAGTTGDGGDGIAAQLNEPRGIAVDTAGNVFIGEDEGHVVRKVDAATGTISTVLGTGAAGCDAPGGTGTSVAVEGPRSMVVDDDGDLLVGLAKCPAIIRVEGVGSPAGPVVMSNGLRATIVGTDGDDVIDAGDGNDVVDARRGDDTVCGGKGDDEINGRAGNDTLLGERGVDRGTSSSVVTATIWSTARPAVISSTAETGPTGC